MYTNKFMVSLFSRNHKSKWNAFFSSLFPENKTTTTQGLGNILSQIVLGKQVVPDFDAEEKASIEKDTREIRQIILEMAEYLPHEDPDKGRVLIAIS